MPASSPPTGNIPNYADEGSGGDDTDAEVERGEKYYVSRISAHRGTKRRSFLVHWVGYEDTTWEPEGRLHGNEALDLYLQTMLPTAEPAQLPQPPQQPQQVG